MQVLKIRIKSMICLVVVKADKGNTVVILNDNRHKKMPTGGQFYATFLILYIMKLVPFHQLQSK